MRKLQEKKLRKRRNFSQHVQKGFRKFSVDFIPLEFSDRKENHCCCPKNIFFQNYNYSSRYVPNYVTDS